MPDIIGEALEDYVIKQIKDRQELHGSGVADSTQPIRDTNIISLLNSNTSWIKLASGVKVSQARLNDIGVTNVLPGSDLAKKYVLYSGFSEYSSGKLTQREGFMPSTQDTVNSSYTYGEYGYSPMPGIISADIKALNRGSIKKASVKLKAHNKQQFGIIDYLYLRLGYTVLLEWGNSIYVTKENGNLVTKKMGSTLIEDGFFKSDNTSHKQYADLIEGFRSDYEGNYDGLLCKVSNFSWTFNDDGSYDIDITLISLGDVVESLKTNVPIDKGSLSFIETNAPSINQADADLIDKNAKSNTITSMLWLWKYFNTGSFQFAGDQEVYIFAGQQYRWVGKFLDKGGTALSSVPYEWEFFIEKKPKIGPSVKRPIPPNSKTYPTTLTGDEVIAQVTLDVDALAQANNTYRPPTKVSNELIISVFIDINTGETTTISAEPAILSRVTIISNPIGGALPYDAFQLFTEERQNYLRFGFLLQYMDKYCIPKVQTDNEPLFKISTSEFGPKMLFEENQISLDPRVCIVKNDKFEKFDPNGGYKATAQIGTRSTAGEPELRDWIEPINRDYAYPLNIYLNFNFIIDSLTSATDERGDINVFSFLSNICNGLNKALGGINNLEPTIDERTNTLHIIDSSLTNQGKDKPYSLKILGYSKQGNVYESNFIRKIDLKTAITPEYATMITIGATAGGYVKGTEGTAFSEWNTGLTDRFKEKIIPANPASAPAPSTLDEAVSNYYAEIADKISECYGFLNDSSLLVPPGTACYGLKFSDNIINKNISIGTEYLKYQLSQNKKSSVGFIPFKLGLKMDGLSGIRIYNKINIDSSYLPPNYGASLDFIVTGVNHSLSGNDWETEISTMVVPGSQKKPIVRPSTPQPSVTSSLPPPTPPTTSSIFPCNNWTIVQTKYDPSSEEAKNINTIIEACKREGYTSPYAIVGILCVVGKECGYIPINEKTTWTAQNLADIWGGEFSTDGKKKKDRGGIPGTPTPWAIQLGSLSKERKANYIYGCKPKGYRAPTNSIGFPIPNHLGNGPAPTSNFSQGDGYKYRGRGFNQITWKSSYKKWSDRIGLDLITNPDLLQNPDIAAKVTALFYLGGAITPKEVSSSGYPNALAYVNDIKDVDRGIYVMARANGGWGNDPTGAIASANRFKPYFKVICN